MATDHGDLSGNVPDSARLALLLIDVINDMEFEGAELIYDAALAAAGRIVRLKRRVKARGIPVIYANDNFGKWRSNFEALVRHCLDDDVRGKPIVEQVTPDPDDYFVLKPSYSAFYGTPLELLLQALPATTLILTGYAGNMCVLFTANDAFMRDYRLYLPPDCTASNTPEDTTYLVRHAKLVLNADVRKSDELDVDQLIAAARSGSGETDRPAGTGAKEGN